MENEHDQRKFWQYFQCLNGELVSQTADDRLCICKVK